MRNEMGNNNVSGIKEEEKAAADVLEKVKEAVHSDVAQTQYFHAEGAELPPNDPSAAKDLSPGRHESNETETEDKEPMSDSQFPGALTEANTSVSRNSEIQEAATPEEGKFKKPLVLELERMMPLRGTPGSHDRSIIQKDTSTEEVEGSGSIESNTISQVSKPANDSTRQLEENQYLSLGKSEEVLKTSITCNIEEKLSIQDGFDREGNKVELAPEESHALEDKSLEMSISRETYDTRSAENKVGDGLKNQDDCEMPLRVTSRHFSDSPLEAVPQVSSPEPFAATPEPQEKRAVHADETNYISEESEKGANKQDSNQTKSSEQVVNQMIIDKSVPSTMLHETYSKENGDQNMVKLSYSTGLGKLSHAGQDVKVTHNRRKSLLPANVMFDRMEQFKDTEEAIKMLHTTRPVSTEFSLTGKYNAEEEARTEKRGDQSAAGEVNWANEEAAEKCVSSSLSFKWENGHYAIAVSPAQPSNSSALKSSKSEKEQSLDAQATSGTLAESEIFSGCSRVQYPIVEASPLPDCKAKGNSARFSVESNPDHPINRVHLRKSPSFDFGLPVDARSQESDQTPLLHHDKTATRNFSGCDIVRCQNRISQTDYGRKSLDHEPAVTVEEKTIRMERSDSDVSSASFVSLLKKDEKANVESTPQKQEVHAADKKQEELPAEELALTSLKGRGKRKPRSSLFSSCMCCTAAIH